MVHNEDTYPAPDDTVTNEVVDNTVTETEDVAEGNMDTQTDNTGTADDMVTDGDVPDMRDNQITGDDMLEYPPKCVKTEAHINIQNQAYKMVARCTRSLHGLATGDNVAVPVAQFDRSKGDPPNLIGVVLKRDPNGYTIGTRAGIIKGTLARNQIEFVKGRRCSSRTLHSSYTGPKTKYMCVWGGGQGYVLCHCHTNCLTKRCSCLKKGLRCNSACHSHKFCDNVDM